MERETAKRMVSNRKPIKAFHRRIQTKKNKKRYSFVFIWDQLEVIWSNWRSSHSMLTAHILVRVSNQLRRGRNSTIHRWTKAYSTIRLRIRQLMLLSFSPISMPQSQQWLFHTIIFILIETGYPSTPTSILDNRMLSIDRWTFWRTISTQYSPSECCRPRNLSFLRRSFVVTRSFVYTRENVLLFTVSVSFEDDRVWAVMGSLTAPIVKLFDGFEFSMKAMEFDGVWWNTKDHFMTIGPVSDEQYWCSFCSFPTTAKKEWLRRMRTFHGLENDTLVGQRPAVYRYQWSSTVPATTVDQLITTNEVDLEVNHKWPVGLVWLESILGDDLTVTHRSDVVNCSFFTN